MNIRAVTWNIGGAKRLKDGEDPTKMASYSMGAIEEIAETLQTHSPDVVALQEAHGDNDRKNNQALEIARRLGYQYSTFTATSTSFIDPSKLMGNGIISKHPISDIRSGIFFNPDLRAVIQGKEIVTHDKGYVEATIHIGEVPLRAISLHLLPFKAIGIEQDSDNWREIIDSYTQVLGSIATGHQIILGDFNLDSPTLRTIDPKLVPAHLDETPIDRPTTPSGKRYDRMLFSGLKPMGPIIVDSSVRMDHYPVTSDFKVK